MAKLTEAQDMREMIDGVASTEVYISNVQWDADDIADVRDLPTEFPIMVPNELDDEDREEWISDFITDKFGFTHKGFNLDSDEDRQRRTGRGGAVTTNDHQQDGPHSDHHHPEDDGYTIAEDEAEQKAPLGSGDFMDIKDALQVVLELAQQNVADQLDHPDFNKEQQLAIDVVTDMAVNQFGDD